MKENSILYEDLLLYKDILQLNDVKIVSMGGVDKKNDKIFKKILSDEKEMAVFLCQFLKLKIKPNELEKYNTGFLKHMCLVAPIIGLLLLQPHFSASVVIIGICSIMMIVAGCKFKHFLITVGAVGIPAIIALIIFSPYRLQRVTTFIDPWQDQTGDGWQVIQSLYAIGSGGLFGSGLGESKQKYLYLPEPHNDFIFSILGEELGFVGCAIVLILFAIFIWRGVLIAMKAPDMFGSLLAVRNNFTCCNTGNN